MQFNVTGQQPTTTYTVDGRATFTVHKAGCAHLRLVSEYEKFDIFAPTPDAAGILRGIDLAGSFRAEGSHIATAPCLPAKVRREVATLQEGGR